MALRSLALSQRGLHPGSHQKPQRLLFPIQHQEQVLAASLAAEGQRAAAWLRVAAPLPCLSFPLHQRGVFPSHGGAGNHGGKRSSSSRLLSGPGGSHPSAVSAASEGCWGSGGRDAAGWEAAGGRGAGLATRFLHQGRGRSARRQRWGTLIVDAGGLGAGQAQADLGPAPEPLPKR